MITHTDYVLFCFFLQEKLAGPLVENRKMIMNGGESSKIRIKRLIFGIMEMVTMMNLITSMTVMA